MAIFVLLLEYVRRISGLLRHSYILKEVWFVLEELFVCGRQEKHIWFSFGGGECSDKCANKINILLNVVKNQLSVVNVWPFRIESPFYNWLF